MAQAWRETSTPPVHGGYLDQPGVLALDCETVWSEQDQMRARMTRRTDETD